MRSPYDVIREMGITIDHLRDEIRLMHAPQPPHRGSGWRCSCGAIGIGTTSVTHEDHILAISGMDDL